MDVKKILKRDEKEQNLPGGEMVEETADTPTSGEGERAGDPSNGEESPNDGETPPAADHSPGVGGEESPGEEESPEVALSPNDGETPPAADHSPSVGGEKSPGEGESPDVELSPLEESQAKAQEYLNGWQRSRAEFANYKKRIAREREQIHQVSKAKVIIDYLGILDDLERALDNRPQEGEGADWAEGIGLIYQKLESKLVAAGVEQMKAKGEKFDPNLHEALTHEENDEFESDHVIDVVEKGYLIGDRVLRPAKVRVAA